MHTKTWPCFIAALLMLAAGPAAALEIKTVTESGITAWLVEDSSVPVVSVSAAFEDAGSASDPADKPGISEFAARAMEEGAGPYDAQQFQRLLEERAITLGTGSGRDSFSVQLSALTREKDEAFRLMAMLLTQPQFAPDAISRVREAMLSDLRQQASDPGAVASKTWRETAFAGHPYAQPPLGTPESLAAIEEPDLRAFAASKLARGNLVMGVVGDISESELRDLLRTHLAILPEKPASQQPLPPATLRATGQWVEVPMDVPQTEVVFGLPGIGRHHKDFYALYVLNQIVGNSGLTSRLTETMREQRGLTYDVAMELDNNRYGDVWIGGFATKSSQVKEAVDTLQDTLRNVETQGVSEPELRSAVSFILGSFVLRLDSTMAIARYLVAMQLYDLGQNYIEEREKHFRAVTLEDVNRAAREWLRVKDMLIVVAGSRKS